MQPKWTVPPMDLEAKAKTDRWESFTDDELKLLNQALIDSGSIHSDFEWYRRCDQLHGAIVKFLVNRDAQAAR